MKNNPYVSVVIPTYNRNVQLSRCLESFCKQTYPKEFSEIIVVNDGVSEKTLEIDQELTESVNLSVNYKEHAGPASARNYGAELSKGELLLFIDDDSIADDRWIEKMVYKYEQDKSCMIGGRTLNLLNNNIYSETSQIINDIVYKHFNRDTEDCGFIASNNLALSKDLFNKLKGFDIRFRTSSSEDRDFCNRFKFLGNKIKFEPDALVYHAHVLNYKTFFLQHFKYGRGAFLYQKNRKQRGTGSLKNDMSFHLDFGNYIFYPFTEVSYSKYLTLAFLLLTWQVANTAGYFWEKYFGS